MVRGDGAVLPYWDFTFKPCLVNTIQFGRLISYERVMRVVQSLRLNHSGARNLLNVGGIFGGQYIELGNERMTSQSRCFGVETGFLFGLQRMGNTANGYSLVSLFVTVEFYRHVRL